MRLIQPLKNFCQVPMCALGARDIFPPANLPHQLHLAADISTVQVQAVTVGIDAWDGAPKELPQQNISQSFQNQGRSTLKQIADTHVDLTVLEAEEAVGVGEPA